MLRKVERLLEQIKRVQGVIRDGVIAQMERQSLEELAAADDSHPGDTIFAIDRVSEELLVDYFEQEVAPEWPMVLIAEGLPDVGLGEGKLILPRGLPEEQAEVRIIVDPIDGTRGIMYQKRSAWILTGVAPNKGQETALTDIELAVQTELPPLKQNLGDVLWAIKGRGMQAERYDHLTKESKPIKLRPSQAETIQNGFAQISRFFPGVREELAAIDEEIVLAVLGPVKPGKTHLFEDQYICSGGQLYELLAGHDRFTADIRPLMEKQLARQGLHLGICCHPYDLATELIAREAGVLVTDEYGQPLRARLDLETDCTWVGYANAAIRQQVEPAFRAALQKRNLL
ncbi:MAG: inositol monophosphatase [Chloroflexota bacterium]|nr:inositol monophosphatase [Chloroflexota bacterium]